MADEPIIPEVGDVTPPNVPDEGTISQMSSAEVEARQHGWKPKEEYGGDASKWVDADEFIKRSDLYAQISKINKALKKRDKELESVVRFSKSQADAAYKRGLAEYQAKLDEAVDLGDRQQVREITKEMNEFQATAPVVAVSESVPDEVQEFVERNDWFDNDKTMTKYATAMAKMYAESEPEWSLKKRLDAVEKDIKNRFPEKFEKSRRDNPSPVEGSAPPAARDTGKQKYHISKLNDEEKVVYEQYVNRHKIMSHEDYFKSLEEIGRKF